MKKRILYATSTVFLLGALTAALLTGCGGGDGGATKEQSTQTETTSTEDQNGSSSTDNTQTPPADASTDSTQGTETTQTPQETPTTGPSNGSDTPTETVEPVNTQTTPTTGPAPTNTQPTPAPTGAPENPQPQPPTNNNPPPTVPTTGPTEPSTSNEGNVQSPPEEEKTRVVFKDSSMEVNLPSSMKFLSDGKQVSVSGMKSIKVFYWNDACVGWHVSGGKGNEASGYFAPSRIVISNINPGGVGNWSMISRDDRELFVDLSNVSASGIDYLIQDNQFYYGTAVTKDRNGNTVPNPDFKCPSPPVAEPEPGSMHSVKLEDGKLVVGLSHNGNTGTNIISDGKVTTIDLSSGSWIAYWNSKTAEKWYPNSPFSGKVDSFSATIDVSSLPSDSGDLCLVKEGENKPYWFNPDFITAIGVQIKTDRGSIAW